MSASPFNQTQSNQILTSLARIELILTEIRDELRRYNLIFGKSLSPIIEPPKQNQETKQSQKTTEDDPFGEDDAVIMLMGLHLFMI